jgi:DNA-binding transcriptional ArsR family regulator
LAETLGTLITLQRGTITFPLVRAARDEFMVWRDADPLRSGLLRLVAATKWMPDVLAIAPLGGLRTDLSEELSAVAAVADDDVRATVRLSAAAGWAPVVLDWLDSDHLAARIADTMADGWERFLRADWGRRRAVLERDIAYRADRLSTDGWHAVIATIARSTAWIDNDTIEFGRTRHCDRVIDDGIIFVPHSSAAGSWSCEQPPHFALTYRARGPASDADPQANADLARLLGGGRARLLLELRMPATSTELARILDVSLGTVSAHLAALRSAGVITGLRTGKQVRYRLEPRGQALLEAFDGRAD